MTEDVTLLHKDDPIPCLRPDYDPLKDYEAELAYRHEMYPGEIPERTTLKSAIGSLLSGGKNLVDNIRDARDTLYGYNGKDGFGIHLKPVEDMEFLPGGYGSMENARRMIGLEMGPPYYPPEESSKKDAKHITEIHHHYHGSGKKKKEKRPTKEKEESTDNFMDPTYIPDSLKKLF